MTGTGLVCPNGHAAVLPGQRFCETCGAVFTMPAVPPPVFPEPAPPPPPVFAEPLPPPPPAFVPQAPPPPPVFAPSPPPPVFAPSPPPPPPPPPTWTQPVPARRGPSTAVVLALVLLVAVAGGAAAFVLIAKPFGGGAASPAPSGVAGATPAASPTASATPPPTAATPQPTPEPSLAPTAAPATPTPTAPEPSAIPTGAPTATCRSETVGVTVTYPAAWYAYTGDPRWTCLLFDPQPIEIVPDSELPPVAVAIFDDTRPAATVAADFETASIYTILNTGSGIVDGRDAVAYEVENTGEGYYEKGVRQTVVIVDRGGRGSLVLETTGTAGARYDGNVEALVRIVDALKID